MKRWKQACTSLAVLGLMIATSTAMAQKTDTPNLPQTVQQEPQKPGDLRLSQKITLSAKKKPVREILAEMTQSSKVIFKAGMNQQDWQVRDLKMNIFVKDLPLGTLMNSITHVMKFRWLKEGTEAVPVYRLCADMNALRGPEQQKEQADTIYKQQQFEIYNSMLNQFSQLAKASPKEIDALKEKQPMAYVVATTGIAQSLDALFSAAPELKQAYLCGQELTISPSDLSPLAQQKLIPVIQAMWKLDSRRGKGVFFGPNIESMTKMALPDDLSQQGDKIKIHINTGLRGESVLGNIQFDYEATVREPNSENGDPGQKATDYVSFTGTELYPGVYTDETGKYLIKALDDDGTHLSQIKDDYYKELSARMNSQKTVAPANNKQKQTVNSVEAEVDHPDYPELSHPIQFKLEHPLTSWDDFLEAYAAASHLPVVADSFPNCHPTAINPPSSSCQAVLKKIGKQYLRNWWYENGVIEVRTRYWMRNREGLIPDALLLTWRDRFKKERTLMLDDLAQIVRLTGQQFEIGIRDDEVLGEQFWLANNCSVYKIPLQIYGALDDRQRKAFMAKDGLDSRWLRDDQWDVIGKLLMAEKPSVFKENDAQALCFTCELSEINCHGSSKCYFMKVHKGDARGAELMSWVVFTPEYQSPQTTQPK